MVCDWSYANHAGKAIEEDAQNTGRAAEKAAHDTGRAVEKAAHDTGWAAEKAAHDTGRAVEKAAHDTGWAAEKAAHDTGKVVEKAGLDSHKVAEAKSSKNFKPFDPISEDLDASLSVTMSNWETGGLGQILDSSVGGDVTTFGSPVIIAGLNPDLAQGHNSTARPHITVVPDPGSAALDWFRTAGNVKVAGQIAREVETAQAASDIVAKKRFQDQRGPLKFVENVGDDQGSPACRDEKSTKEDVWPFDVQGLIKLLSETDQLNLDPKRTQAKILIVDSGFDFLPELQDARLPDEKYAFPSWYFFTMTSDRYDNKNPVRWEDNKTGTYGVNLAGSYPTTNAQSSVDDLFRSHGLSVTTLALGGRGLEELRHVVDFAIKADEADLVQAGTKEYSINMGEFSSAIRLASSANLDVVNLSLTSTEDFQDIFASINNTKPLLVVSAAGNGPSPITTKNGPWPAAWGGAPTAEDASHTAFVTVGAHDPNGRIVDFSNTGAAVDLLAPGCGIPTYELKISPPQPPRLSQNHVNGTSFAAPVVSFVAGLLATDRRFSGKPGLIKTRLILSTDFNSDLAGKVFSSGILNARKALSFNFDVVELTSAKAADLGFGKEPIRLGKLKFPVEDFAITCDNEPVPFADIEKFSIDVMHPDKQASRHVEPDAHGHDYLEEGVLHGRQAAFDEFGIHRSAFWTVDRAATPRHQGLRPGGLPLSGEGLLLTLSARLEITFPDLRALRACG